MYFESYITEESLYTDEVVSATHAIYPLDLTNSVLCIGGFDTSLNVRSFESPMQDYWHTTEAHCKALDQYFSMDSFSVGTGKRTHEQCFQDVSSAISVDDVLQLGLVRLPVSFEDYLLFIVPSAVVADAGVYNQCVLKKKYGESTTITPTERDGSTVQSRITLSNAIDTSAYSRRQNTSHAIMVVGDTIYTAKRTRPISGGVPIPVADENARYNGFSSTQLPYDMEQDILTSTELRESGHSLVKAGNRKWPITSLRFFDRGLSSRMLQDGQLLVDPAWADPVYFFRPYELQAAAWVDSVTGTAAFAQIDPFFIIDMYPHHDQCAHTAGGFLDLLSHGGQTVGPQYAPIASMVVTTTADNVPAFVYTADTIVRLEAETTGSTLRIQSINRQLAGKIQKRFVRQVLKNTLLKGYIEGPPPCPGENLSQIMHATYHIPTLADTVFQKSQQSVHTTAAKSYVASGSTEQTSGSVSVGFQADMGFSFGGHVSNTYAIWGSVGLSGESSESNRTALSSSQNQDATNKITEYMIQITGSQECVNSRDMSADRPNMPTRFVVDNVGVAYVSADVENEFVYTFNGQPFSVESLPLDQPKNIELSVTFPMNPRHRIAGSLDGTVGLTAADLTVPFIHPSIRNDLTISSYNEGKKASYSGHPEDAAVLDRWVNDEGAKEYTQKVKVSIDEVRKKYLFDSKPQSGKTVLYDHINYDTKTIPGTGNNSYRCSNPGIDDVADPTMNRYNILFPSIKQSSSVQIQAATSRSGHASSSRSCTQVIDDKYSITSRRYGYSGGLDGLAVFVKAQFNQAIDYDHVWEHSQNEEITTDYSTQVTNNVPDSLYDSPYLMLFENIHKSYDESQLYLGQRVSLDEGPLFEALATYDQVVINHYRSTTPPKKCFAVKTSNGLILAHTQDDGTVKPLPRPGSVVGYQYDTYLITRHPDSWNDFFDKVVDPVWGKTNPLAIQMKQSGNPLIDERPDRTTHFVNYVDRNVAELTSSGPTSEPVQTTFANIFFYAGDAAQNLPVGSKVVPFQFFHRMQSAPKNLGYVLEMLETYPQMIGCIVSRQNGEPVFLAAVLTEDIAGYYRQVWGDFPPASQVESELYLVHRHVQEWNSSNTLLLDAKYIAAGQPSSKLITTNYGIVEAVKAPAGAFSDYVTGSTSYVLDRLETTFELGQMATTLNLSLLYYFHTIQTRIGVEYQRYKTLQSSALDISMVGIGSKLPIVPETRPEGLVLDVRESSLEVYLTKEPHYSLPVTSWWGICRATEYAQDFRQWIAFGYVSHQMDDFHIFNPNRLGDGTSTFIGFTVSDIPFEDDLYIFAVFTEEDVELRSQTFHPRINTDFVSVYQWNRSGLSASTQIQTVYTSSTEHGVVVTLVPDCVSIEISLDETLLTLHRDSDWVAPPMASGTGLVVVKREETSSVTTVSLSVFGVPGYYTIVLLDSTGGRLDQLETFIGGDF